jgi:hypothetical protein
MLGTIGPTIQSESHQITATQQRDELPPVFGCHELPRFLLVDVKTVQGLAQRREVPCRKVRRVYRFYRPSILAWLAGPPPKRRPGV